MKAWTVAAKDLRVAARDRQGLIITLLMPLVLILILGLALGGIFQSDRSLEPFQVGVVNADTGFIGQAFSAVLDTPELRQVMTPVTGNADELREQVARGRLKALVIIPAGASAAYAANTGQGGGREPVRLEVIEDAGSPVPAGVVRAVVAGFATQLNAAAVSGRAAATVVLQEAPAAMPALAAALLSGGRPSPIALDPQLLTPRENVSAMAYYAVAMSVMFLLFGAYGGSRGLLEERSGGTLTRMLGTPTSPLEILAGKLLGTFLTVLAQFAVLVLFTRLAYGVRWGPPLGVALLGLAAVLAATGLGTMVASLCRNERQVDVAMQAIIFPMTLLGGGFLPLYAFGPTLLALSRLSINGWATAGFLDLMTGRGTAAVLPAAAMLAAMGLAGLGIGAARLRLHGGGAA